MRTNENFSDLLTILLESNVEFLLIGAHAVMVYTKPRFTKDMDIWINPKPENAKKVYKALKLFGAPLRNVVEEDFSRPEIIYQMGGGSDRIDICTLVDGLEFDDAYKNRNFLNYGSLKVPILSREDLIKNKKASGRPQDILDLQKLQNGDFKKTD